MEYEHNMWPLSSQAKSIQNITHVFVQIHASGLWFMKSFKLSLGCPDL